MSNPILGRVEKDAQSGYAGFRDSSTAPQQGYQPGYGQVPQSYQQPGHPQGYGQ